MRGPLSVYRVLKLFMLQCVITLNFGGVGFERALSVYSTWRCFCWMGPTVAYKYVFLLTSIYGITHIYIHICCTGSALYRL